MWDQGARKVKFCVQWGLSGLLQWKCWVLTTGPPGNSQDSLSNSETAVFLLWTHKVEGVRDLCGPSFIRALIPFIRALPSWPIHLPKAPPPNTSPLEIRLQHMKFGGMPTAHPKFIVYIRFHSWCHTFQMYYTEYFHCPKIPCIFSYVSLPAPKPLSTTDLCTVSMVLPFPERHIVGIIQHVAFSDWFLSLSNVH